jgi:hypothetical protein
VLGGADYPRVRVGIGEKPKLMNQADWVLSRVTEDEWPDFESSIGKAAKAVETLVGEGVDAAMNAFNERLSTAREAGHPSQRGQAQIGQDRAGGPRRMTRTTPLPTSTRAGRPSRHARRSTQNRSKTQQTNQRLEPTR